MLQLHRHAFVIVNFISISKIILSVIGQHFVMSSSLLLKDITVTRFRPIVRTMFFKSNISLSIVDDKYSFERVRNTLDSLIFSIESLEPPSFWYTLYDNSAYSFCESLRLED